MPVAPTLSRSFRIRVVLDEAGRHVAGVADADARRTRDATPAPRRRPPGCARARARSSRGRRRRSGSAPRRRAPCRLCARSSRPGGPRRPPPASFSFFWKRFSMSSIVTGGPLSSRRLRSPSRPRSPSARRRRRGASRAPSCERKRPARGARKARASCVPSSALETMSGPSARSAGTTASPIARSGAVVRAPRGG